MPQPMVLIAEDSSANRMIVEAVVRRLGYRVTGVADGALALDSVSKGGIDLVLMDVSMPTMDGLEATRRIRQLSSGSKQIPIIAMTAHDDPEDRERCLGAGMTDYIAKPVKRDQLATMLSKHLTS